MECLTVNVTSSQVRSTKPTLGLAMIVRNEAAIIERCLARVKQFVDHWTIVDTGSTDGTPDIIRRVLGEIPGALYDRPWVDFGTNRTELMALAKDSADFLLLLDADHVVDVDTDWLDGMNAWADVNDIHVRGTFDMWMPYLVSGRHDWSFTGATHEYLVRSSSHSKRREEKLRINDQHDGSSHTEKLRRDEQLLIRQIEKEPNDSRWAFYLAQTRQGAGNINGAIAGYRRCIELSTWDEEIYWCLLQIGELLQVRGDWPEAVIALEAAWEFRPTRAESLFLLAAGHRERNMYLSARMFAEKGLEIAVPADSMFVRRWVYDWGLTFEQSVAAWWMGEDELAVTIWRELLERDDLSPMYREFVAANLNQWS